MQCGASRPAAAWRALTSSKPAGQCLLFFVSRLSPRLACYLSPSPCVQDPTEILDQYGADALRLYLINSPVVRAESLRFQCAPVLLQ